MISIEVCANSALAALAGQDGGAIRVELCDNLHEGGTTPSAGQILLARKLLHIKLYVMIRPRGGDFLYNDLEYEIMQAEIRHCIEAGCDGIVTGILNPDGTVDKERNGKLVQMARQWGLGATFHRAFDMCTNLYQAMEDAIEVGFERILTSGGKTTAMEGAGMLNHLIEKAAGRIDIMPGCGIDEHNVADLVHYTGATEIHTTAKVLADSSMTYHNENIIMGTSYGSEYGFYTTSKQRVAEILRLANTR